MHLRFVTHDNFVGCLAQILVKVETVDCTTSGVDCFSPKDIRSLVLIKHGSCGFNQCPILPFHNVILLRSLWNREFMPSSSLIKSLIKEGKVVTYVSRQLRKHEDAYARASRQLQKHRITQH